MQQNPLRDYQNEGHELFDLMMQAIEEDTSKYIKICYSSRRTS